MIVTLAAQCTETTNSTVLGQARLFMAPGDVQGEFRFMKPPCMRLSGTLANHPALSGQQGALSGSI